MLDRQAFRQNRSVHNACTRISEYGLVDVGIRLPSQDQGSFSTSSHGVGFCSRVCAVLLANSRHVAFCEYTENR
jgi:hypothetical protein